MMPEPDENGGAEVADALPVPAGGEVVADHDPVPPGEALGDLWGAGAYDGAYVGRARDFAETMLAEHALPAEARNAFDALPVKIQHAAIAEIGLEADRRAPAATDDELADLRDTDAGAELVAEWGRHAALKYGVVLRRLDRMFAGLSETEGAELMGWFKGQPPAAQKAALRSLAG